MSRKAKKVHVEKVEPEEEKIVIVSPRYQPPDNPIPEPIKDEFDKIFPDDTDEVSLDDAARVLDVSVPVAKLWMLHGHMTSVGTKGFVRVSRESVRNCYKRFIMGRV